MPIAEETILCGGLTEELYRVVDVRHLALNTAGPTSSPLAVAKCRVVPL